MFELRGVAPRLPQRGFEPGEVVLGRPAERVEAAAVGDEAPEESRVDRLAAEPERRAADPERRLHLRRRRQRPDRRGQRQAPTTQLWSTAKTSYFEWSTSSGAETV